MMTEQNKQTFYCIVSGMSYLYIILFCKMILKFLPVTMDNKLYCIKQDRKFYQTIMGKSLDRGHVGLAGKTLKSTTGEFPPQTDQRLDEFSQ